jgi:HEAT repeat protein
LNASERALGADILGQLGIPERTFPEESFAAVLKLLSDSDINVLRSAILALQHIDAKRAAAHVAVFQQSSQGRCALGSGVRFMRSRAKVRSGLF